MVALLASALDLAIKLLPSSGIRVLIPGILGIRYTQNQGVAFGMLSGVPRVQTILVFFLILSIGWWLHRNPLHPWPAVGAGLILGGAVGNLLDRLIHGAVQDYLEFLFFRFPVFNLADTFITLGAVLLMIQVLWSGKKAAG